MDGWCPRHDRIVESPDRRCPECGTPLVATQPVALSRRSIISEAPAPAASEGAVPTPSRPQTIRAAYAIWICAAVLFVFAVGFATGRQGRTTTRSAAPSPGVNFVVEPRTSREIQGITIALERVVQHGGRIVATFDILSGIDPALITDVQVAAGVAGSEPLYGGNQEVRSDGRFDVILDGTSEPIRFLRIEGMSVRLPVDSLRWDVDISRVWPATPANEPQVIRVNKPATIEGRTITLRSVLAWHDRLEAAFVQPDFAAASFEHGDIFFNDATVARLVSTGGEELIEPAEATFGGDPPNFVVSVHAADLPDDTGRIRIALTATRAFSGGWSWSLSGSPHIGPRR